MFINTCVVRVVYSKGSRYGQQKTCLTGNKINSNIITEIKQLDKKKYTQDICDNYAKVITNQKNKKFSVGFLGALLVLLLQTWHSYSYKEYIISKADLDKAISVAD